jgi:murein L,D-transpeptidase YafK
MPTYRILATIIPLQAVLMLASSHPPISPQPADHIVISKSHHTLTLYYHDIVIHTYPVALGRASGPKQFAGDHKTPEGHYLVDAKNPHSRFHLALHLSYPNPGDRTHATAAHRSPGADIEIHGQLPALSFLGSLHRTFDWTDGCIALTNAEIDEIYPLVPTGTPIDITP